MTTTTPVLACGHYLLNLQCPDCQLVTEVAVYLDTRLTVDSGGARLAAKLGGKPVDHLCNQLRLLPPRAPDDGLFTEPARIEQPAGDMT